MLPKSHVQNRKTQTVYIRSDSGWNKKKTHTHAGNNFTYDPFEGPSIRGRLHINYLQKPMDILKNHKLFQHRKGENLLKGEHDPFSKEFCFWTGSDRTKL